MSRQSGSGLDPVIPVFDKVGEIHISCNDLEKGI